jgi:hypothetical protein
MVEFLFFVSKFPAHCETCRFTKDCLHGKMSTKDQQQLAAAAAAGHLYNTYTTIASVIFQRHPKTTSRKFSSSISFAFELTCKFLAILA